jgi:hypothetical protein
MWSCDPDINLCVAVQLKLSCEIPRPVGMVMYILWANTQKLYDTFADTWHLLGSPIVFRFASRTWFAPKLTDRTN